MESFEFQFVNHKLFLEYPIEEAFATTKLGLEGGGVCWIKTAWCYSTEFR